MYNLFKAPPVEPWKPETLSREQWPPNYDAVYRWRTDTLKTLQSDPQLLRSAKRYYALHRKEFALHWMDTYDPRKNFADGPKWVPFVFFTKQAELWDCLDKNVAEQNNALVEKARDMGATWLCVDWSVAGWLFEDGIAIGWGSRKQELVDRIGDASSIFEKLRLTVNRLPKVFRPNHYDMSQMKLINHDNGATITGEIGDSIGRGGRTSIYFKDESAHYERPDMIEGALGDNTNVQVDISSVNGPGNVFHRRRNAGVKWPDFEKHKTSVFVMDWSDHPAKTQEWYEARRARFESEGLEHVFAQEVDRNYNAAVANTVIMAKWLESAIDLHLIVPGMYEGKRIAGLDVADGGIDKNAWVCGKGRTTDEIDVWGDRDTGVTTRRAIAMAKRWNVPMDVMYDSVGVGSGVKAEYNRLVALPEADLSKVQLFPWNAGGAVQFPHDYIIPDDDKTVMNSDFYHNVKAQAWWHVRNLFRHSWEYVTQGIKHPPEKMLSISRSIGPKMLEQLKEELVQPVYKPSPSTLKMLIDKKPDGVASPNIADAFVMRYYPIYEGGIEMQVGFSGW